MRVVVVGAGIGGLATAVGLQRAGADVAVLEQADGPRGTGSGLSIFGNGWTALDALGLGGQARALALLGMGGLRSVQRTPDGTVLTSMPPSAVARLGVVHRADLHDLLLASLGPGTVRHGTRVAAVSEDGHDVVLADGSRERADVVVAADGISSGIRAAWPQDPGLRYAGYVAWRGVTATPVNLLGAAGETWGRGRRLGLTPLRDGRVYWYATETTPPGSAVGDAHAEVVQRFASWHAPVAAVLAATPPAVVTRLDVRDLARPLPTFRRGRCVLLGDAAHAMTPDLGQGANQALEDAVTLARLLRMRPVDDALAEYDRLRRPRTRRLSRAARATGVVGQAHGAVAARVRDAAVRMAPGRLLAGQVARIESWQPPG